MIWATTFRPLALGVTVSETLWIAGALVVILVMLQSALVALDAVLRIAHSSAQRAREVRLLEVRVAAARKRRSAEQQQAPAWNGWRKFTVAWRVPESGDVCSFYLKPHDGKRLRPFRPGQYLTFRLEIPGQSKPVIRCYSLSDCEHEDYYRVSIKRVRPPGSDVPPGVASCFFHDLLCEGEIVDVMAPNGSFHLDPRATNPVVLLAGGIGVTPILSMLNAVAKRGRLSREVYFFYGVSNCTEHAFRNHLEQLAQLDQKLHLHVCYSRPFEHDVLGTDYHTRGHITLDLLKKILPSSNFHYYLCGPPAMMETLITGLTQWGVPDAHIHSESFGESTTKAVATATGNNPPAAAVAEARKTGAIEVQFARSGRTAMWRPGDGTLLEFAEQHQVAITCGCRAGNCGSCTVAIKNGEVVYQTQPGFETEMGSCLACCAIPKSVLVLDA